MHHIDILCLHLMFSILLFAVYYFALNTIYKYECIKLINVSCDIENIHGGNTEQPTVSKCICQLVLVHFCSDSQVSSCTFSTASKFSPLLFSKAQSGSVYLYISIWMHWSVAVMLLLSAYPFASSHCYCYFVVVTVSSLFCYVYCFCSYEIVA